MRVPTDVGARPHAVRRYQLWVLAGVVFLGAQLTVGLVKSGKGITGDWNVALGIIAGAVTGSKLVGQKLHNDSTALGDSQKDVTERKLISSRS